MYSQSNTPEEEIGYEDEKYFNSVPNRTSDLCHFIVRYKDSKKSHMAS